MAVGGVWASALGSPIEDVMEEGYVTLAACGEPAGGLGDLIYGTSPLGNPCDGMAGAVEGLQTGCSTLWGRNSSSLETVFEGVQQDV